MGLDRDCSICLFIFFCLFLAVLGLRCGAWVSLVAVNQLRSTQAQDLWHMDSLAAVQGLVPPQRVRS